MNESTFSEFRQSILAKAAAMSIPLTLHLELTEECNLIFRQKFHVRVKTPVMQQNAHDVRAPKALVAELGVEDHVRAYLLPPHVSPSPERRGCGAGSNYVCIAANGDVFPCPAFRQAAGNIRRATFSRIWREAPLFRQLRAVRSSLPPRPGEVGDSHPTSNYGEESMTDENTAPGAVAPNRTDETDPPPKASSVYVQLCVMWTERLLTLAHQCAEGLVPGGERCCLP